MVDRISQIKNDEKLARQLAEFAEETHAMPERPYFTSSSSSSSSHSYRGASENAQTRARPLPRARPNNRTARVASRPMSSWLEEEADLQYQMSLAAMLGGEGNEEREMQGGRNSRDGTIGLYDMSTVAMAQIVGLVSSGVGQGRGGGVDPAMADLMMRDLTAEDYERLLQLDPAKNEGASDSEIRALPVFTQGGGGRGGDRNAPSSSSSSSSGKRVRIANNFVDLVENPNGSYANVKANADKRLRGAEAEAGLEERGRGNGKSSGQPIELDESQCEVDNDKDVGEEKEKDDVDRKGAEVAGEAVVVIILDDSIEEEGEYGEEEDTKDNDKELDQCCICMEVYEKGEQLMRLPCFHAFHAYCSTKWLKMKACCPVCNERIDGGSGGRAKDRW